MDTEDTVTVWAVSSVMVHSVVEAVSSLSERFQKSDAGPGRRAAEWSGAAELERRARVMANRQKTDELTEWEKAKAELLAEVPYLVVLLVALLVLAMAESARVVSALESQEGPESRPVQELE